jgi:hypothetical protein
MYDDGDTNIGLLQLLLEAPRLFLNLDRQSKERAAHQISENEDWVKYTAIWTHFEPLIDDLPRTLVELMKTRHLIRISRFEKPPPECGDNGRELIVSYGKTIGYTGRPIVYSIGPNKLYVPIRDRDYLWGDVEIVYRRNSQESLTALVLVRSLYEGQSDSQILTLSSAVSLKNVSEMEGSDIFFPSFEEYIDWLKTTGHAYRQINILSNTAEGLTVRYAERIPKVPKLSYEKMWALERKRFPIDTLSGLELDGKAFDALGDALGDIALVEDLLKYMVGINAVLSASSCFRIWQDFKSMWRKKPYQFVFNIFFDAKSLEFLSHIEDDEFLEDIFGSQVLNNYPGVIFKALEEKNAVFLKSYFKRIQGTQDIGLFLTMYYSDMGQVLYSLFEKLCQSDKTQVITFFLLNHNEQLACEFLSKAREITSQNIMVAKALKRKDFLKKAGTMKNKMASETVKIYELE